MSTLVAGLMLSALPALKAQAAPHANNSAHSAIVIADGQRSPMALPVASKQVEQPLMRVAHRRYKRHYHGRSRVGRYHRNNRVRGYRRYRHHMRTPSHYTFSDFPTWAARAFEPARTR